MKNDLLKTVEECFSIQYEIETKFVTELEKLNINETIEEIFKQVNLRLKPFDIELFQYKGVAYNKNEWCSLFICEPQFYEKITIALEGNEEEPYDVFEDTDNMLYYVDLIHAPDDYRFSELYKKLLESDFYNKELLALELKNSLPNKDEIKKQPKI